MGVALNVGICVFFPFFGNISVLGRSWSWVENSEKLRIKVFSQFSIQTWQAVRLTACIDVVSNNFWNVKVILEKKKNKIKRNDKITSNLFCGYVRNSHTKGDVRISIFFSIILTCFPIVFLSQHSYKNSFFFSTLDSIQHNTEFNVENIDVKTTTKK